MIIQGLIVAFLVAHGLTFFMTRRSIWYWLSKFFFALESIQGGLVRSVPLILRFKKKFEVDLAEICYLLETGWEISETEDDGFWLFWEA